MPRQQLTQEELVHQEAFSIMGHLPSEPLMRAKNPCLLLAVSLLYSIARLLPARCASRGEFLFVAVVATISCKSQREISDPAVPDRSPIVLKIARLSSS